MSAGARKIAAIVLEVLSEPMFLLLIAAAGIYLVLGDVHEALVLGAEGGVDPLFLLLIAAAVIYLVLGDVHEALVLGASVLVMIGITVAQARKAERALEALRDLSSPRAVVLRDGERRRIAGQEVVRGDLLLLAEGDRVPADARLESSKDRKSGVE